MRRVPTPIAVPAQAAGHWRRLPTGRSWQQRLTPSRLFVGSFLVLIAVGTAGLLVLPGLYTGPRLGFVDALFTATSAVCVTGLIVVDTATYFTVWGQAWLLLLIQLGGLGLITFATVILASLGRRLSLRYEAVVAGPFDAVPALDTKRLVRDVLLFTFAFEAAGALLLYAGWAPRMGPAEAAWPSFFHAVSAFCNAGFSTFSDSLMGFQRDPYTLGVVALLIVAGGLGFLTMEELLAWRRARRERRRYRLSLHSLLVLGTTAVLLVGGAVLFVPFEWGRTLDGLPWWARLVNGAFMSVTARTAGFNAIDYGAATDNANFLTVLLMFVGGSPGSTAGGVKTTTMALLGLLALSRLRGLEATSFAGRSVPEETERRAVGLVVLAALAVTAGIFLLTTTEEAAGPAVTDPFLRYTFEAFSAFNTVGLSMNLTPTLSTGGRWIILVLMFVGRVGPLTAAAALTRSRRLRASTFRYAYEDVEVG
jgi:trk system potassium uptake protein TrkH